MRTQALYPPLLLAAIILELGGGVLFLFNKRLGAQMLVRPPSAASHSRRGHVPDSSLLQVHSSGPLPVPPCSCCFWCR